MLIKGHHVSATRTIEVIDGKATNTNPKELATVQSLFEYTFDTIKNTENEIDIQYDTKYGYPTKIEVTISGVVGGSTIIVQELEFKEN